MYYALHFAYFQLFRAGETPYYFSQSSSLSNSVFERRTSTGSGLFASLGSGLVQTLGQIVFIREKKLSNTNLLESRRIKEKKASLPVDVRRSKTSLLKLPTVSIESRCFTGAC